MDLEIGCEHVEWIQAAQDREQLRAVVNAILKFLVIWKTGIFFFISWAIISFWARSLFRGVSYLLNWWVSFLYVYYLLRFIFISSYWQLGGTYKSVL